MGMKVMGLAIFSLFTLVVLSSRSIGRAGSEFCNRTLRVSNNSKVYDLVEPGYKLFCTYEFEANPTMQLKLTFTETDFQAFRYLLDYILVFDGADCLTKRIGVVYKRSTPVFISSRNRMTALFIKITSQAMFKGTYAAVASTPEMPLSNNRILRTCGGEITGRRGNVSFRGDEAYNALCIWRFTVERGKRVHLQLTYVQLIYGGSWIRILDGGNCAAPEMVFQNDRRNSFPYTVKSTSNELTLLFASGYGSPEEGIEASYSDGEPADLSPTTLTPSTVTDVRGGSVTDIPEYVNSLATRHTFEVLTAVFVHATYYFYWITMA